ncbi:tripartite tricarboxylate transporter substrate binding protein [Sulfitobacter sp. S190]|uniref:Bug family tripartite tricarboxylate transporter substrate binding protein n=1 Tax=Sulfitobacter sp. S190 TaxID=2867022 RepID=UPI0021A43866|nr:tripartite tricarboxylate transporter substrate-binding protein [Sulfitobacter sp. S190]UWR23351.1 tripartite tricarboxylate transporter substrate-binding protein [Sulfitobacter sp. S190]
MKTKLMMAAATVLALLCGGMATASDSWSPDGPIKMLIGFRAGGGADTQARLIAQELEKTRGWTVVPENITGQGGINALNALADEPADGTALALVVTESLGYNLAAAPGSNLSPDDFTPLTTTAGLQLGVVATTRSGFDSFADLVAAAQAGEPIRFGAMSPKLADLAYLLGQAHGVQFNTVMMKGGKGVMNALNAGDIDVGWVAGLQTRAVEAGDMVNLVSGLSTPLRMSPDAPTLAQLGVPYNADGYFVVIAPAGLSRDARAALTDAVSSVVGDPQTAVGGLIVKTFGGAALLDGARLEALIRNGYDTATPLMQSRN